MLVVGPTAMDAASVWDKCTSPPTPTWTKTAHHLTNARMNRRCQSSQETREWPSRHATRETQS